MELYSLPFRSKRTYTYTYTYTYVYMYIYTVYIYIYILESKRKRAFNSSWGRGDPSPPNTQLTQHGMKFAGNWKNWKNVRDWAALECFLVSRRFPEASETPLRAVLETSWGHLGSGMGGLGKLLGGLMPSCGVLGTARGLPGAVLEAPWAFLARPGSVLHSIFVPKWRPAEELPFGWYF